MAFFFFFKQKTAYEMRISDWSSDVCSSDLIHGMAKGGTLLNFGSHGLKALAPGRITARQIEASRRAITRHMKRAGRVWIRIFPDLPVSQKPAEVRQGKGKGAPEYWAARVHPGRIMFEIEIGRAHV